MMMLRHAIEGHTAGPGAEGGPPVGSPPTGPEPPCMDRPGPPCEDWARIYDHLAPYVRGMARRGRRPDIEPDDAAQEAWLAVLTRIRSYRPGPDGGRLLAWLLVVIRHRLADLGRHAARRCDLRSM